MQARPSYQFPAGEALDALDEVNAGVTALVDCEAWMRHFNEWLRDLGAAVGLGPAPDDEAKDARAKHNMLMERIRALRGDLETFATDAQDALPPGVSPRSEIVREPHLPQLGPPKEPADLLVRQREFLEGSKTRLGRASAALMPLRDRLRTWDDPRSQQLGEAIHGFVDAVRGGRP